ncbi:MAG: zinc ABC transporter substrate-binding protein [Treponema sp.]|nr:zinc ABC transporter substrate-binding protein [Treponema sp.]
MRINKAAIPLFFYLLLLCACSRNTGSSKPAVGINADTVQGSGKPVLALSILPQQYFAQRIAGDRVDTMVLAGPGANPHSYEPTPGQLRDLAGAGAWVISGIEFEITFVPKIRNLFPSLPIIDGTEGVHFRILESNGDTDITDIQDDDDVGIDRHTWLGSEGAKIMASHIRDALCELDSADSQFFNENYNSLVSDIDQEFAFLKTDLAGLNGKTVLVYHPAFGYFLDEFGIIQDAVETGGKEPTPRVLTQIIERAKSENIKMIFVQAQFPSESAGTVAAAVGAEMVVLDPLALDWLDNIKYMGEVLKRAVQQE